MINGQCILCYLNILPVQVVQTCFDVGVIVVDLVLIESCLGVQGAQCLLKLNQLCFPSLSVAPLVPYVLSNERVTALR